MFGYIGDLRTMTVWSRSILHGVLALYAMSENVAEEVIKEVNERNAKKK